MARQFYLENSLGKKYELTNKNFKQFLNEPEGLGFSKNLNVLRIGNDELITDEQYSMPSISGEVLFYDNLENAYQDYLEFVNFVRYSPLKLYYLPPNMLFPYYIECSITQVDKSEYQRVGYLSCPVTFYGYTLWQNSQESNLVVSNSENKDGKYYELIRPYHYAGNSLNSIEINNTGDVPIGFVFEVVGSVTNPRLIASQNRIVYGQLKLNGTFDYIRVDSNDLTESIYLENNGTVITNPLSYQDLSIADGVSDITFFKLKIGESKLSFSCDKISSFQGNVSFKWKDKKVSI